MSERIAKPILRTLRAARHKRFLIAVMTSENDAIHLTEQHTSGVNLAVACAALVKAVLGRLDPIAERKFLEEFVTELRNPIERSA